MNTISISRRRFAQLLGAGAAAVVVRPAFSFATEPVPRSMVKDVVRLSANENHYGHSPKELKAMNDAFSLSCRYPDEHNGLLIYALFYLNGLNLDYSVLGYLTVYIEM